MAVAASELRCACGGVFRYEKVLRFGFLSRCDKCSLPNVRFSYPALCHCSECGAMYTHYGPDDPGCPLCPEAASDA